MKKSNYFSLDFINGKFVFLDQTKLPLSEIYIETESYKQIAEAIEKLEVRGAPLIGICAAYALALSLKDIPKKYSEKAFYKAVERLARTRPTAVNLFWAIDEMKKVFEANKNSDNIYKVLLNRAKEIHADDIEKCRKIGENGLRIFKHKSTILTHCNTGKLATGGDGTAFNVIKTGFEKGLVEFVYADETRPLLQGLRLTSFELKKNGIPFKIQSDSSAATLMQKSKIDFVVVGADRIALNGDTANKIGTYNLAVSANYHNIPFYVAAPSTTIDKKTIKGDDIKIEFRNKNELTTMNDQKIAPDDYDVYSPAFDVTPAYLITGIITEKDVYFFPYNFINE
ncbi:MAG: S-methyl-5-thioribose-1-phosphate isomerase [Ignavibacteria bacterium RBG_16_34_14]|nr:MAG: S-methyl-5-thioribose-1-phosphate isomerase [Ignavibacteria bacterium RBG_16_34_14]